MHQIEWSPLAVGVAVSVSQRIQYGGGDGRGDRQRREGIALLGLAQAPGEGGPIHVFHGQKIHARARSMLKI